MGSVPFNAPLMMPQPQPTSESDVYVDAPVKFIVPNDDIAGIISAHAIVSRALLPVTLNINANLHKMAPTKNPFAEKLLPGSHGKSSGGGIRPE